MSASAVRIEALAAATLPPVVDLLARFFAEEGFTTPRPLIARNLAAMLADPSCWTALAVGGGEPTGIVTVTTMRYVEWGLLGEIGDLYVLPGHRHRGIARALVGAAIEWCRGKGWAVSVTITPEGEERHALSQFYARFRFQPTGRTNMSADLRQ